MSKTKSLHIVANNDKATEIAEAIEDIDLDRPQISDLVERLSIAVLLGKITLNTQDRQHLQAMAKKYIPDAPKKVKVEQKVQVEQYLQVAMAGNPDAYDSLVARANQFALAEAAKTQSLYDSKVLELGDSSSDTPVEGEALTLAGASAPRPPLPDDSPDGFVPNMDEEVPLGNLPIRPGRVPRDIATGLPLDMDKVLKDDGSTK